LPQEADLGKEKCLLKGLTRRIPVEDDPQEPELAAIIK
jgi:hypothetical protein